MFILTWPRFIGHICYKTDHIRRKLLWLYGPRHEKTCLYCMCTSKMQISMHICPVWSETLLSAWSYLRSLASHWAHSEDWSDCADVQADLSHCWVHVILLVLSCCGYMSLVRQSFFLITLSDMSHVIAKPVYVICQKKMQISLHISAVWLVFLLLSAKIVFY